MRRFARIDGNQDAIVEALARRGCSVVSLAPLGNGIPDLLVGFCGETLLFEIKDGSKPPSARRLTPLEQAFFARWRGGDLRMVESVDEALAAIGVRA
jgi:hypothetical protein